ncbi:hypothetical protein BT69DRAFT_1288129 [Atractiella rhizophila]|nr:hypothetical protein BT69DRAFT_1288129 [Atractiella rhizophila]
MYLGYVHGIAGILSSIISAPFATWKKHESAILQLIEWSLKFQAEDGNFLTFVNEGPPVRLHFCHGGLGFVILFCQLLSLHAEGTLSLRHELKEKLLASVRKAADCLWQKGLLKKGINICHGVAGSAYGFLHLSNLPSNILSNEERHDYLWKATRFALFAVDREREGFEKMDFETSLFCGTPGTALMWSDLLTVVNSKDGRGDGKFLGLPFIFD